MPSIKPNSVYLNQQVINELTKSLSPDSAGGKTLTGPEAQSIIDKAQQLPAEPLRALKTNFLQALTAKDSWQCTPDARDAMASFLGVPPEKLPAPVGKARPEMGAMFTKARNEAKPTHVKAKDVKKIVEGVADFPPDLREMCMATMLGMKKDNQLKFDAQGNKHFTKGVVKTFGTEGPDQAMAHREASNVRSRTASAESYLSEVIASGGSFEDILFAFMMLMSERAEDQAMEAMEALDRRNQADALKQDNIKKAGKIPGGKIPGGNGQAGKPTPTAPGKTDATPAGNDLGLAKQENTKQVTETLESLVQSAHHSVTDASEGGVKITTEEARNLTSFLGKLPDDVQKVLANSIEKSLQRGGVPVAQHAHYALEEWGSKVLGRPFDIRSRDGNTQPPEFGSDVAKRMSTQDRLEDRISAFLVDTLYQPDMGLEEKMDPFKALTDEMTETPAAGGGGGDATIPGSPETGGPEGPEGPEGPVGPEGPGQPEAPIDGQAPGDKPLASQSEWKSDTRLQQEFNDATKARERAFTMLTNVMRALHDTQMTIIRNLR